MKTLKLTQEQRNECDINKGIKIIDGPVWKDECDHPKDSFVCSFELTTLNHHNKTISVRQYDLYIFPDKYYGEEVCIRYSNNGGDYISPGPINRIFEVSARWDNPPYNAVKEILLLGQLSWNIKQ